MNTPLLAVPVVAPILGAAVAVLVGVRRELQRVVTVAVLSVMVVAAAAR